MAKIILAILIIILIALIFLLFWIIVLTLALLLFSRKIKKSNLIQKEGFA